MGRGHTEHGVRHITKEQYNRAVKNGMFLTQEDFNAVLGVGNVKATMYTQFKQMKELTIMFRG